MIGQAMKNMINYTWCPPSVPAWMQTWNIEKREREGEPLPIIDDIYRMIIQEMKIKLREDRNGRHTHLQR